MKLGKKKINVTDFALGISRLKLGLTAKPPLKINGEARFADTGDDDRVTIRMEEVASIMKEGSKGDANMPNTPEGTSFTLSEFVKKEYALSRVYSREVAEAHRRGDLHLHKLAFIDRPYCAGQSVEYVKKYGLNRYASFAAVKPAVHIDAMIDHLYRYSLALRANFGGAIGWDAVNLYLAPFLVGLSDQKIYQAAQQLIYQFNQTVGPHGGQPIFSDMNLYWEVPDHLAKVPAIGPRGKYTGKVYNDYKKEAQSFVWQIFEVYKKGDAMGRPFFWPKPDLHITEKFWRTPGHERFLTHVSEVAAKTGNPYFIFDRGKTAKISECCRVSFELSDDDLRDCRWPWRMRYAAAPYVSLNLPRLAYLARGSEEKFFEILKQKLALVVQAHLNKKAYLKEMLALGEKGPLGLLTIKQPGEEEPYLRMRKMSFLVGVLGVGDCVYALTGERMHKSEAALKLGLKIVAQMKVICEQEGKRLGMKMVLEQDPAESTAYRFARLDLEYYRKEAEKVVHGNLEKNEVYYTNSTHLDVDAPVDPLERVEKEGLFHPLILGGNISHIWLGEHEPSAASVAQVVKKTFFKTQNTQIAFSPEFTFCRKCGQVSRGLKKKCVFCRSAQVDGITRITGYYTFTSGWGAGKRQELKDRCRLDF